MLYSIRMRSAKGGAHENGGHHISGAERILSKEELAQTASELVTRALTHSKGCADLSASPSMPSKMTTSYINRL